MNTNKFEDKLNKSVNEDTELINSLSLWKYVLIYVPILFLMFTLTNYLATLFSDYTFDWKSILIQTLCFALFFRIYHKVRKIITTNWRNKHN